MRFLTHALMKAWQKHQFQRLVNYRDVVTRAPYFGYFHVGELHWYAEELKKWIKNPMDKTIVEPIPAGVVDRQLEYINRTIKAFWSMPYLSLLNQALGDSAQFNAQVENHSLDAYLQRLWSMVTKDGRESSQGPERCQSSGESDGFDGSGFVDESSLRN